MNTRLTDLFHFDSKIDPEFKRVVITLQIIALIALGAVMIVVNTLTYLAFTTWILFILFLLVLVSLILAIRGYLIPGRVFVPISLIPAITVILYKSNGIHDTAIFSFPVVVLMGGMLMGRKWIWLLTLLCIGGIFYVAYGEMNGLIVTQYSVNTGWDDVLITSTLLAASASILNLLMKRMDDSLLHSRENEKARERSEELYRRAIITAGAVPYYLDHRTRTYTFMGEGILQMTGYSASEMNPDLWESLEQEGFPRGNLAHLTYEEADRLTEEDGSIVWECDYRIRTRDGQTRWVADTSVKGLNEFGERVGVIGILQDITDRKNALIEREKLIRDLEARNTELERFSYTVSHDLKAPLVTIQGYLGYIEADALNGNHQRLRKDIQRVKEASTRMQNLLKDLLELSRVGRVTNPLQDVPLSEIIQEALSNVAGQIATHKVTVNVMKDLPVVHVDRARLVEVFQNLVDNACNYMGTQNEPHIDIGQHLDADRPVFYVRDNGKGIESQYHEKIFGLFNKLDPKSEGTGIGLTLVKRIIEVHGGRIWVESEGLGKGSTFYFTLKELAKV